MFGRYLRIGLLVLGAALLFGITTAEGLVEFYDNGHGPLAQYPFWVQGVIFLVVGDFMLYWIHRGFHRPRLWKFHAVHHSSEEAGLDFRRALPPNQPLSGHVLLLTSLLLIAGISPNVLVFIGPFTIAHSAFVHANLNWTLGPFKYVICGTCVPPLAPNGGRSRGLAAISHPTFPIFDVHFGTFYMPAHERPDRYGVADPVPASFGGQLLYPFK